MQKNNYSAILITLLFTTLALAQLPVMSLSGKAEKVEHEFVSRRDINGRICAAIKISSDIEGLSYDAYSDIVGDIDHKPGQDMVYLQPDEQVLMVYATGYEPLKLILADTGIRLKPKEVWKITITGESILTDIPVVILTEPEGVLITIDGEEQGASQQLKIPAGTHEIRITSSGYVPVEETITVDDSHTLFKYTLSEIADVDLQISTTPDGAEVIIDGVKFGTSPISDFYPEGVYPIEIRKDEYLPYNGTITIAAPRTKESYKLEENFATLTIITNELADVFINGEKITNPTNMRLAPQRAAITVKMNKATDIHKTITLKKGDDKTLELLPDVATGQVTVVVKPLNAAVELTGDAGEQFTSTGKQIFRDVPIGVYQLKVSAEGYKSQTESFTLKAGEKIKQQIELKAGSDIPEEIEVMEIKMVLVKGGTYAMGCRIWTGDCDDNEKPVHTVTVSDFYLSATEVTQAQWRAVMGSSPSYFKGDDLPVERVSWDDVQTYIEKLNQQTGGHYRLPTEAEWEYAARSGGKKEKWAGTSKVEQLGEYAWFDANSDGNTHPVGTLQPNGLGLYDMCGNVWEWCRDWYRSDYYASSPLNDPKGPSSGSYRVLRGGSWGSSHRGVRCSNRGLDFSDGRGGDIGFRLAGTP